MKIGINWSCVRGMIESAEEQARIIKNAGFDAVFLGVEPPTKELVEILTDTGLVCENLHAPFQGINDIWFEGAAGDGMLGQLLDSVDHCADNHIPVLVVHLSSKEAPRINEIGYTRWKKLVDYAGEQGVTVAFENQRMLGNIAFAFEQFPTAKFCWDCGHESCFTPGRHYMPLFGDKLAAIHIHDNDRNYNEDLHMIPGDGKIDFEAVAQAIAASDYDKSLMLEVSYAKFNRYEGLTAEEFITRAAFSARRIADRVEEIRKNQGRGYYV